MILFISFQKETHFISLAQQVVREPEVVGRLLAVPQQASHLAARDVKGALVLKARLFGGVKIRQRLQWKHAEKQMS